MATSPMRRDLLRGLGTTGALMALTPWRCAAAAAQSPSVDLPSTITEAAGRIRNRQMSVTELTRAYLKHARELQPRLNAFITIAEEHALTTAGDLDRELDHGRLRGPLHLSLIHI